MKKAILVFVLLAVAICAFVSCNRQEKNAVSISIGGDASLTLMTSPFGNPLSTLDLPAPKSLDNCTLCNYLDAKLSDIIATSGPYQGEGSDCFYVAGTFYLKNAGANSLSYREKITLGESAKKSVKALRVLVIRSLDAMEGEIAVYAAPKADGSAEEVVPTSRFFTTGYKPRENAEKYQSFAFDEEDIREDGIWMTKPFASDTCALESDYYPLHSGETVKYTLLIWLEGNDEQCTDDILGETLGLTMTFSVRD